MPDWLIEILRQFPMVVVIGLAIWYADKRVREKEIRLEDRSDRLLKELRDREERFRNEFREDRDSEIARFQNSQDSRVLSVEMLVAAKDEQIAELTKQLASLVRKIQG